MAKIGNLEIQKWINGLPPQLAPNYVRTLRAILNQAHFDHDAVAQQISDIRARRGTMEGFLRILKQQDGEVTAFSEKLWCGLLDYATAYADGRVTFTFKNGSTFEG